MNIKNEQNLLNGLLISFLCIVFLYFCFFPSVSFYLLHRVHKMSKPLIKILLKTKQKQKYLCNMNKFDISVAPFSTLDYQTHFKCCSINIQ